MAGPSHESPGGAVDIGARELQRVREETELLYAVIAAINSSLELEQIRLGNLRLQGGADRGTTLAELVDTGRTPELIEPFTLERFYEDRRVSELAAAAVSHRSEDKRGRRP